MMYSAGLQMLLEEAEQALLKVHGEFHMGAWREETQDCGTRACMCGWMAVFRGPESQPESIAIEFEIELERAGWNKVWGSMLYGGGRSHSGEFFRREKHGNNAIARRGLLSRPYKSDEQIARQLDLVRWMMRRNRALWVHEQRAKLPRRFRKSFDIDEKALRDAA